MGSGDMELDGGGIPMEDMSGIGGYAGLSGEDTALDGMFEDMAGMEGSVSCMSGEDFEPADMGGFGGSFARGMDGFPEAVGDFDHGEAGYDGADVENGGMGYGAGGISGMEEGGVSAGAIGMAGGLGSAGADRVEIGIGEAGIGRIGTGSVGAGNLGSGQGVGNGAGRALGAEGGMAGSSASGAGNMDSVVHGMPGAGEYGSGMPGVYRAERDGEGYLRYDASRYERPRGAYQTIHENGKTFYELPERAKAPGILPETRASLEKDGTLKMEKIYREQRSVPGSPRDRAETGSGMERPETGRGKGKAGTGDGYEKSGEGFGERKPGLRAKPEGKQGVKQRRNGQGAAGNEGQPERGRDQRKGDGRR